MRTMFDSTTPWDIPRDAQMVAYYVDGRYAWPQAWLDMFPNAVKVSISAIGVRTAQVGDVEVGCIWPPANAVPWVRRARSDGYDPTIYVNELNDWLPVRRAFWDAGEPEPHYWVARFNGVAQVPDGAVARQYAHPHDGDGVADRPWETGAHFDKSAVLDYWPGVDQRAPGGGKTERKPDMIIYRADGDDTMWLVGPAGKRPLLTGEEAEILVNKAKVPAFVVSPEVLEKIASVDAPDSVTMTPEQLAELAAKVRAGMLDELAPLFDLARRLKD